MTAGKTALNALVGGAVAVVLSFVPFSPVLGGAVAGYLQRGSIGEGATVGLLAGLIALVPGLLLLGLVSLLVAVPTGPPLFHLRLAIGILVLLVGFYAVVLSVVGGVVGAYLAEELGEDPEGGDAP